MESDDAIFLQVLNNRLRAIVEEMAQNCLRAAHSTYVKETWDLGALLTTTAGEAFVCPKGIAEKRLGMHLGPALERAARAQPGDIFICNDPRVTDGMVTHLPDIFLWKPIFASDGELVCMEPIRICLTLQVEDDTVTLDFEGSDPEVRAAYNVHSHSLNGHWGLTRAFADYFQTLDPDVPWNSGLLRPILVRAPKGSVLNPRTPAACGARVGTYFRVYYMTFGALAQAVPGAVPASGAGQGAIMLVAAHDPVTGERKMNVGQPLFGGGGVSGGLAGARGRVIVNPGTPREEELPVVTVLTFNPGDVIRVSTAGGGGFADPVERDAERVAHDVAEGYLDAEAALRDYGVVLVNGRLDPAKTAALRQERRARQAARMAIDYGPERVEYERVWTPELYAELDRLAAGRTRMAAQYLREQLVAIIRERAATGQPAPAPENLAQLLATRLSPQG